MTTPSSRPRRALLAAVLCVTALGASPALAQDKVNVGVFPVSSSLPYFVALERGFFKEQNIAPEMARLIVRDPATMPAGDCW